MFFGQYWRQEGTLGRPLLSPVQPGARGWTQIGRGLRLCADRGDKAAAEVDGTADLFLPPVLSFACNGTSP